MDIDAFFQGLDEQFASGSQKQVSDYLLDQLNRADAERDYGSAVTILNEMVGFYRSISDHKAAIRAGDQAIEVLRTMGYENSVPFGTTLLNAATAHRAAGDNVRALELFTGALGILHHHLDEDDHQLAGVYNNASAIYEELGKYDDALENLEKAVSILKKHPGMEVDAATAMTNLALVLLKMGRQDQAVATLEKAMATFQAAGKSGSGPHYAAALAGMAEASYRMGRFEEAVGSYEAALEQLQQSVGKNADFATTCRNCAVACEALGDTAKAESLMVQAHDILTRLGMNPDLPDEQTEGTDQDAAGPIQ